MIKLKLHANNDSLLYQHIKENKMIGRIVCFFQIVAFFIAVPLCCYILVTYSILLLLI